MKVAIEKKVTETIDVEPGYYKSKEFGNSFYHLLTSGVVVYLSNDMIYFETPDQNNHANDLKQIAKSYKPCDQSEFESAKDKVLGHLQHYVKFPEMATSVNPASGQAGVNNMFDPNQQQQEATNEQATNAQESASQDQAMEVDSEEEGSTEG